MKLLQLFELRPDWWRAASLRHYLLRKRREAENSLDRINQKYRDWKADINGPQDKN